MLLLDLTSMVAAETFRKLMTMMIKMHLLQELFHQSGEEGKENDNIGQKLYICMYVHYIIF